MKGGEGVQGEWGLVSKGKQERESVFNMDSKADELMNSLKTAWPGIVKQCLCCLAEHQEIIIWAFFSFSELI